MNQPGTKSRRRKWLVVALSVVVGLTLFAGVSLYILGRMATARWNEKLAELRAKGEPVTFEEIESRRAVVPDELNGALIIEGLGDLLGGQVDWRHPEQFVDRLPIPKHVLGFSSRSTFGTDEGTPRYAIEASREFVKEHADIFARLSLLETRPTGRFHIADECLQASYHPYFRPVEPVRKAGKLLRLDAVIKLADGDLAGASSDAVNIFHVAGTLNDDPAVISRLVSIAVQALAVETVENILSAGELDSAELNRLAGVIDGHLLNMGIRSAFWGERASIITMTDSLLAGQLDCATAEMMRGMQRPPIRPRLWDPFVMRSDQIFAVEMLTELIDAADDPTELMDVAARQEATLATAGWLRRNAKILIPSLARSTILVARVRAEMLAMRAALAAEQYRLANGTFPNSLAELVPAYLETVPIDPFTGKPLLLRTADGTFEVYSVGENRKDDGGVVRTRGAKPADRDNGARLLPPNRRGVLITDEPPPEDE